MTLEPYTAGQPYDAARHGVALTPRDHDYSAEANDWNRFVRWCAEIGLPERITREAFDLAGQVWSMKPRWVPFNEIGGTRQADAEFQAAQARGIADLLAMVGVAMRQAAE